MTSELAGGNCEERVLISSASDDSSLNNTVMALNFDTKLKFRLENVLS